jgi:ABC-type dipeptide/oligopeptide/nickel transport system permease component
MSHEPKGLLTAPAKRHEARAIASLVLGICSIVLIYPLGILLGPLALWFGISGFRRINRSGRALGGSGLAIAGIVMGAIVCALYALIVFFELVAFVLTGGPMPAP